MAVDLRLSPTRPKKHMRFLKLACATLPLGLAAFLLSCSPAKNSESPPSSPPPTLGVEYTRCWAVYLPGPVCVLWPDRMLALWVEASPGAKVEIRSGGKDLTGVVEEVSGGRRYRQLTIPPQASSLTVSLISPDGKRGPSWSLRLAEPAKPPWLDEIEKLGDMAAVRQRLLELRKTVPRREQGFVLRSLAYTAQRDGNDKVEAEYLQEGLAVDHAENCMSCEAEKATSLARLHLDQGRFSEARKVLEVRLPPESPAKSKYLVAYYLGLLADAVGDYRSALEQLRKAADLAERVGISTYHWMANQILARLLQDLGRSQDASNLFAKLQEAPQPQTDCDMGDLLMNQAWSQLIRQEGGEKAGDPVPLLKKAQKIYDFNSCATQDQRLNVRLNLVLAYQQAGRWRESRRAIEQARPSASQANLRLRLWWHDLDARTALAEGNTAYALRLYEELEGMATRGLSLEGRFRASFGRARAQIALGQPEAALVSLAEADHFIDKQSRHVPVHEGRDTLIGQREAATRLHLKLLLDTGLPQDAFALARRARSRLLRQLTVRDRLAQLKPKEQDKWDQALASYRALRNVIDDEATRDWQLSQVQKKPAQERREAQLAQALNELDRAVAGLGDLGMSGENRLAPPRPGEVVFAYHPLPQGWVGFAAHDQGIEVSIFELPASALADRDPVALGQILLEPFHRVLERAQSVRVLPYGSLQTVDFHTLSFGGKALLARCPVVYSLDLPPRPASAPPSRRKALLIVDPEGNLPAAQREADAVAKATLNWKPAWSLDRLDRTAARAKDVKTALPTASLFHYAGHGTFGGSAGWDSVLKLADDSRLTPGDLLALPQAPNWVLLSACDAGRTSEQASVEGIGLAQAFLLAGSQAVVAATRPVPDATARDLMDELYRRWKPGADLPRQFQKSQQACLQKHPAACASFRLFEP